MLKMKRQEVWLVVNIYAMVSFLNGAFGSMLMVPATQGVLAILTAALASWVYATQESV